MKNILIEHKLGGSAPSFLLVIQAGSWLAQSPFIAASLFFILHCETARLEPNNRGWLIQRIETSAECFLQRIRGHRKKHLPTVLLLLYAKPFKFFFTPFKACFNYILLELSPKILLLACILNCPNIKEVSFEGRPIRV